MIRVFVASEQYIIRKGIRALLDTQDDLIFVGEALPTDDIVERVRSLQPRIVLLTLHPEAEGVAQTIYQLKQNWLNIAVLVLVRGDEVSQIFATIAAGATGFIRDDASEHELLSAMRGLATHGAYICPMLLNRIFQDLARRPLPKDTRGFEAPSPDAALSPREYEVLRQASLGFQNREIARRLGIGEATVKTHMHRVFQKLRVSDRTQAALWLLSVEGGRIDAARPQAHPVPNQMAAKSHHERTASSDPAAESLQSHDPTPGAKPRTDRQRVSNARESNQIAGTGRQR